MSKDVNALKADIKKAEQAVEAFLSAWKKRDWKEMKKTCQITWQENTRGAVKWLEGAFNVRERILKDWRIVKSTEFAEAAAKVEVAIKVYDGHVFMLNIGVTGEIGAFRPDPSGVYGVNPISVLKFKEIEKGGDKYFENKNDGSNDDNSTVSNTGNAVDDKPKRGRPSSTGRKPRS